MSMLQQFASYSEAPVPVPPPAEMPAAISPRQQLVGLEGAPPDVELYWQNQSCVFPERVLTDPAVGGSEGLQLAYFHGRGVPSLAEWIKALGGSKPREQAIELHHTLWGVSHQEHFVGSALRPLEQAYVLEDRSAIPAFIKQYRLLEPLLEARGPLTAAFGEATVKKLTLVEDDEGFVTLFCFVLVPGGLDEARWALNSFDDSWWLAHSHETGGKLNFDFELV